MAHFPYVRAPGTWVNGSAITPAECEAINLYIYKAGNFDGGGTWAPTDPIIIGGDGLSVTGTCVLAATTLNGVLTVASGADINIASGGDLNVQSGGDIELASGGAFLGLAGSTVTIRGTSTIDGVMTYTNLSNPIIQSGSLWTWQSGSTLSMSSGSQFTLNGDATIGTVSTVTQNGKITRSGTAARTRIRTAALAAAADANISVDVDHYRCDHTGGTTHTFTALIATSPVPLSGEEISVTVISSGAGGVSIKNEGSAANIVSGVTFGCIIIFDGTKWRLNSWSGDANPGADG